VGPTGFYGYELTIRAMRAEGITLVPLDLDHSVPKDARDRHMTETISHILSQDPNAKIAVLLGRDPHSKLSTTVRTRPCGRDTAHEPVSGHQRHDQGRQRYLRNARCRGARQPRCW